MLHAYYVILHSGFITKEKSLYAKFKSFLIDLMDQKVSNDLPKTLNLCGLDFSGSLKPKNNVEKIGKMFFEYINEIDDISEKQINIAKTLDWSKYLYLKSEKTNLWYNKIQQSFKDDKHLYPHVSSLRYVFLNIWFKFYLDEQEGMYDWYLNFKDGEPTTNLVISHTDDAIDDTDDILEQLSINKRNALKIRELLNNNN